MLRVLNGWIRSKNITWDLKIIFIGYLHCIFTKAYQACLNWNENNSNSWVLTDFVIQIQNLLWRHATPLTQELVLSPISFLIDYYLLTRSVFYCGFLFKHLLFLWPFVECQKRFSRKNPKQASKPTLFYSGCCCCYRNLQTEYLDANRDWYFNFAVEGKLSSSVDKANSVLQPCLKTSLQNQLKMGQCQWGQAGWRSSPFHCLWYLLCTRKKMMRKVLPRQRSDIYLVQSRNLTSPKLQLK